MWLKFKLLVLSINLLHYITRDAFNVPTGEISNERTIIHVFLILSDTKLNVARQNIYFEALRAKQSSPMKRLYGSSRPPILNAIEFGFSEFRAI
jgi:hypothetical protein